MALSVPSRGSSRLPWTWTDVNLPVGDFSGNRRLHFDTHYLKTGFSFRKTSLPLSGRNSSRRYFFAL